MSLLLKLLHDWAPFRLDALGLVTIVGAEEVSTAVGALKHSYYTEYLPIFGTYLIAENKFTSPIPGFSLYNISDGVHVPIVNGWFSRWLISHLESQVTILEWQTNTRDRNYVRKEIVSLVLGILLNGGLMTLCALQGDYYGLANAAAMATSIIVRRRMVRENRHNLDHIVSNFLNPQEPNAFLEESEANLVKIVITAPEDKLVAFKIPRGLLPVIINNLDARQGQITRPSTSKEGRRSSTLFDLESADSTTSTLATVADPNDKQTEEDISLDWIYIPQTIATSVIEARAGAGQRKGASLKSSVKSTKSKAATSVLRKVRSYNVARAFGWIAFAVHVISIGSSTLATQMLSVGTLIVATIMTIYHVGGDVTEVGRRLSISTIQTFSKHREAFAWLDPTQEEINVLEQYKLLPYKSKTNEVVNSWNQSWWKKWLAELAEKRGSP